MIVLNIKVTIPGFRNNFKIMIDGIDIYES